MQIHVIAGHPRSQITAMDLRRRLGRRGVTRHGSCGAVSETSDDI